MVDGEPIEERVAYLEEQLEAVTLSLFNVIKALILVVSKVEELQEDVFGEESYNFDYSFIIN